MTDVSALTTQYLELIASRLPEFAGSRARILPAGQFNTVLCLDERWIFRFPKSPHVAPDLAHELALLPRLQGKLPLPIPEPRFSGRDDAGSVLFMGYAMLPGAPLLRERYAGLQADGRVVDGVARDLADFLLALHAIPPAELGLNAVAEDARAAWAQYGRDFREQLFPHMRVEARRAVERDFASALSDDDLWRYDPCLTHGDFGAGNILFHAGRVSGIIDFSFCGLDDPAQDLGALIASYGEDFAARLFRHYPALRRHLPRARFYCGNYALIQALYALRDDDAAEFEDGIADFR
ncbi:MAG: phosphotransferase [Chloroflexi bacterium]|nr:phosphotransferase [Chloroflexota bacterium]